MVEDCERYVPLNSWRWWWILWDR